MTKPVSRILVINDEHLVLREFVKGHQQQSDYTDAWIKPGALPVLFDGLSTKFKDAVAAAKADMGRSAVRFGQQEKPPF